MTGPRSPRSGHEMGHRLTRPDLAADYVRQILEAKVRAAQEAEKPPPKPSRLPWLLGLSPILVGLTLWNILRTDRGPPVFSPTEEAAALRFRIYLAAQAVLAYRDSAGRLPRSLQAIGADQEGMVYAPVEPDFLIAVEHGPWRITYRSGEDLRPYALAYQVLQREAR